MLLGPGRPDPNPRLDLDYTCRTLFHRSLAGHPDHLLAAHIDDCADCQATNDPAVVDRLRFLPPHWTHPGDAPP